MKKTGLIFDVDGTLCDSTDVMQLAWNEILDKAPYKHVTMTREFISQYMGKPMDDWARAVLPGTPIELSYPIMEQCCEQEYVEIKRIGTQLYPGVHEAFKELSEKYHLYILSNCGGGYIELVMQCAGIEQYVDSHLCYGDTNLDKPENIKLLVKREELTECAYIGDTARDEECCKEAGVPFIYAAYGFGEVKDAAYQINEMKELKDVAERLFADLH